MPVTILNTGVFNLAGPVIRGVPWYYNSGTGGSGTTFTVAKDPSVQPGDTILVFVTWNGTGATPSIPGFTAYTKTANAFGIALFSRSADGTEGAAFTVTLASGYNVAAVCVAYQGSNGALDPVPSSSGTITLTTTTITTPGITTTQAWDTLIWFGAARGNGTGAASPVITVPAGLNQEGSQSSSSNAVGANMSVVMADGVAGVPGATGAMNGTSSLTDDVGAVLLALQPAGALTVTAGLAAGSGHALLASTGAGTNASAGVAAATGAAQAIQAGLGTILGAYIDESQYAGGLTHAQAISHWNSNTGRTMGAERMYLGKNTMQTTVTANMSAALSAGRVLALSYKPSMFGLPTPLGGGASQAALDTSCNTFMAALISAGFNAQNCLIDLWQEPWYSGITGGANATAANFITMFRHYYPIISGYGFTVGFCTSAASVYANGENSYYPGDAYCDYCLTDYYYKQYPAGHLLGTGNATHDAAYPADNAVPPKPFGIGEFASTVGASSSQGDTQANVGLYYNYLMTYFQGRLAAGQPCAPILYFNSAGGIVVADGATDPTSGLAEYRNAMFATLTDGVQAVT